MYIRLIYIILITLRNTQLCNYTIYIQNISILINVAVREFSATLF